MHRPVWKTLMWLATGIAADCHFTNNAHVVFLLAFHPLIVAFNSHRHHCAGWRLVLMAWLMLAGAGVPSDFTA
jgi:hypothetical protein